jgi:hypothetical protein
VVELSHLAVQIQRDESEAQPVSHMRFLTLLCWVAMKCQDVTTRLAALESMPATVGDENSWDLRMIHTIAARTVEKECGIPVAILSPSAELPAAQNDVLRNALERLLDLTMAQGLSPTSTLSITSPRTISTDEGTFDVDSPASSMHFR